MDIKKMIAIVQLYIHIRKDKEVSISIKNTKDLLLLSKAYGIAIDWINNNNIKISYGWQKKQ